MDSIAVIILNYMTWQETLREVDAVRALLGQRAYEIIVVDNNSPNQSRDELAKRADGSYTFLASEKNGGYAAGNNIGLRYAAQKGHRYSWILNNDIVFDKPDVLEKMLGVFDRDETIAAVSPDVYAPDGYLFNRNAVKPNLWDMTFGMLAYKKKGRADEAAKNGWLYVYHVQGCCMLLDTHKLAAVDFMDEATFLYCEEMILAERLLKKGYRCACCSDSGIIHNHSYTVRKALSKYKYVKSNVKSFRYYLKTYRKCNVLTRLVCCAFFGFKTLVLS